MQHVLNQRGLRVRCAVEGIEDDLGISISEVMMIGESSAGRVTHHWYSGRFSVLCFD